MKKLTIVLLAAALAGCGKKENAPEVVIPKFTVTFEFGGGSQTQSVDSGNVAQKPTAPTKPDSCFLGWYTDSARANTFDFASPITANTTLYAKWSRQHTITFVLNGGTGVTKCYVCDSVALSLPDEPTKDGYSFVNWCIDSLFYAPFSPYIYIPPWQDNSYSIPIKVTKDTTLYAQWINGKKIRKTINNNVRYHWCAYEDEPGLYSNQTTGYDSYNGRKNTGGEANDVCRSRGAGWYLPAYREDLDFNDIMTSVGSVDYWSSTMPEYGYNTTEAYYFQIWEIAGGAGVSIILAFKTTPKRVRCVWRPLYEN